MRSRSSVVAPDRRPWPCSARRTQWRSVSPEQPIFSAIEWIADHWEVCSAWWSRTIRTARARTSGEYGGTRFVMAPSSQESEPPENPVRFTLVDSEWLPMGSSSTRPKSRIATGPAWSSTRSVGASPCLELIWADGGYNAWQVDAAVAKVPRLRLEIVKRSDDIKGFVVLPRRWVVERTFSWFGRNRRLAKDFESLAETMATFVTLASIQLALRR